MHCFSPSFSPPEGRNLFSSSLLPQHVLHMTPQRVTTQEDCPFLLINGGSDPFLEQWELLNPFYAQDSISTGSCLLLFIWIFFMWSPNQMETMGEPWSITLQGQAKFTLVWRMTRMKPASTFGGGGPTSPNFEMCVGSFPNLQAFLSLAGYLAKSTLCFFGLFLKLSLSHTHSHFCNHPRTI